VAEVSCKLLFRNSAQAIVRTAKKLGLYAGFEPALTFDILVIASEGDTERSVKIPDWQIATGSSTPD
jgi:hypothetical protein